MWNVRHVGKLPRSTLALKNAFTIDALSWDEFLDGPTENICRALEHFTGSDDFNVHIASTSLLEKGLREFISPWHDELQNLIDEPTIIYCHIFHKRRKLPKVVYRALRCERAVEESEVRPHFQRLLKCLNRFVQYSITTRRQNSCHSSAYSVDDGVRFRALQLVQAILGLDHYCSSYFLKAFAEANHGNIVFSSSLVPHARQLRSREYGEGVIPDDAGFLRHMSIDGTFHIGRVRTIESFKFLSLLKVIFCSHTTRVASRVASSSPVTICGTKLNLYPLAYVVEWAGNTSYR